MSVYFFPLLKRVFIPLFIPLLFLSACGQSSSILTTGHAPHLAWTAPIGSERTLGKPVVANGMVYLSANKLFAWDVASGQQKWTAPIRGEESLGEQVVVANGVVYCIGSSNNTGALNLFALDAVSGQQKWSAPGTSFLVASGMVYITNEGNGKVSAWDAASGQQKWTVALGVGSFYRLVIANGLLYTTGYDQSHKSKVSVWDAVSGQQKWTVALDGNLGSAREIAIVNGVIYLENNDPIQHTSISAWDATSGRQKWIAHFDNTPENEVLANGVLYVGPFGGSDNQTLSALDAASGQQKWTVALGDGFHMGMVVANDMIYFGEDREYAFDATSGQRKWTVVPGGIYVPHRVANFSAPTVANSAVYVVSYPDDSKLSNLYLLDAASGQEIWAVPASGANIQTVFVANGLVYVLGAQKLYAFSL